VDQFCGLTAKLIHAKVVNLNAQLQGFARMKKGVSFENATRFQNSQLAE
jgi:hypothetical protein